MRRITQLLGSLEPGEKMRVLQYVASVVQQELMAPPVGSLPSTAVEGPEDGKWHVEVGALHVEVRRGDRSFIFKGHIDEYVHLDATVEMLQHYLATEAPGLITPGTTVVFILTAETKEVP